MRAFAGALVIAALVVAAASASTVPATLRVIQKFDSCCYVEGSIGYVQIRNRLGRLLVQKTFRREPVLRFAFTPGTWRLVSFQRPCDGNCSYLDPPTDRCKRTLTVRKGERFAATVHVSPGNGCEIRLRRD